MIYTVTFNPSLDYVIGAKSVSGLYRFRGRL